MQYLFELNIKDERFQLFPSGPSLNLSIFKDWKGSATFAMFGSDFMK